MMIDPPFGVDDSVDSQVSRGLRADHPVSSSEASVA